MSERRKTRIRGLKLIGIGAVLAAAFVTFLMIDFKRGRQWYGPGLGAPALPLLVGLVEAISGRSFASLSRAWDELAGWQRFLLGVTIAALATVTFIVIGGTIVTILTRSQP